MILKSYFLQRQTTLRSIKLLFWYNTMQEFFAGKRKDVEQPLKKVTRYFKTSLVLNDLIFKRNFTFNMYATDVTVRAHYLTPLFEIAPRDWSTEEPLVRYELRI